MSASGGISDNDGESAAVDVRCEGVVIAVGEGTVSVSLEANPACNSCKGKASCSLAPDGNQVLEVPVSGFVTGDRVRVLTNPRLMLTVSLSLYLVPTVLLIIGSFVGYYYGPAIPGVAPDMGGLLGVVTGILLSLAYVHYFRVLTGTGENLLKLEKVEELDG